MKNLILKAAMLTSFAFVATANAYTPEECGEQYMERYEWFKEERGLGKTIGYMYGKDVWEFYNDGNGGILSYGWTVIGFPVIAALDVGLSIADGNMKRGLRKIGMSILDPESKYGKKGAVKLFRIANNNIKIKKKEFIEFYNNDFDKFKLCSYKQGMKLTEKGKALVGEDSFYIFMYKAHGTPLWDEFWNDPRNYSGEMILRTRDKQDIRSVLTEALIEAGYERK